MINHDAVESAVRDVIGHHCLGDVLVSNAGRTHVGAVEQTTDADLRDLFQVHAFGSAALTSAVLPPMRSRQSGADPLHPDTRITDCYERPE